jgi:hypothetical protein
LNQNIAHSVYRFFIKALYEYDDEIHFKNHLKLILHFQFTTNFSLKNSSSREFLPLFFSAIESEALESISSKFVEAFLNQDYEVLFDYENLKSLS